jgi:hypothetical protein
MKDIRGSKYLRLTDIERCPYLPKDEQYDLWNRDDIARCQRIVDARRQLHIKANQYLSHEDRNVRQMAICIGWFFGDVE